MTFYSVPIMLDETFEYLENEKVIGYFCNITKQLQGKNIMQYRLSMKT